MAAVAPPPQKKWKIYGRFEGLSETTVRTVVF